MKFLFVFVAGAFLSGPVTAQKKARPVEPPAPVAAKGGHLVYTPDERGNQIPDFSYSGYMGGDSVIPTARVRVVIQPMDGDATFAIQRALDYVSGLPVDEHGLRGAVLLGRGVFSVAGGLVILLRMTGRSGMTSPTEKATSRPFL